MSPHPFLPALLATLPLVGLTPPAATGAAQPAAERHHATPRLITERDALVPGQKNWLGVEFRIDPGWHLYWDGLNDTGMPPKITPLNTPAGFSVGDVLWPAPTRHAAPGEILDHVYKGSVLLMFPVSVPPSASPGDKVTLAFGLEWLECAGVCLFAEGNVSINLPVANDAKPSRDAPLFERTRAALPGPIPNDGTISAELSGDRLTLSAKDAIAVAFFPLADCSPPVDLWNAGETKGPRLVLTLKPKPGNPPRAHGVLRAEGPSGKVTHTLIDLLAKGNPSKTRTEPSPDGKSESPTGTK
ncbi:MAG: hypothetical protein HRU70_02315 [Phycisphaeraceae bacterium]|nr:MAG: hypothetical protein HRU70_02315 [Phycisphaeraceae bacterium]